MLPPCNFYWFRIDNKHMAEPWLDQALIDSAIGILECVQCDGLHIYIQYVPVVSAQIVQLLDWGAVKNWPRLKELSLQTYVYFFLALNIKLLLFLPLGLQMYLFKFWRVILQMTRQNIFQWKTENNGMGRRHYSKTVILYLIY